MQKQDIQYCTKVRRANNYLH